MNNRPFGAEANALSLPFSPGPTGRGSGVPDPQGHKSVCLSLAQKSCGYASEITGDPWSPEWSNLPLTPFALHDTFLLWKALHAATSVLQMARKKLIWSSAQLRACCWRPMGTQWQFINTILRTNHTEAGHKQSTWRAYWGKENSPPHVPLHAIVIQPFNFIQHSDDQYICLWSPQLLIAWVMNWDEYLSVMILNYRWKVALAYSN